MLVVGHADGAVSAWEVSAGTVARRWQMTTGNEVIAIGAAGDAIAVARRDRVVTILDEARRRLLLGTWGGGIVVVDVDSGRVVRTLDGHTRLVGGLAVDASNGLVASASRDGSVRLWDLESGAGLATVVRRDAGADRSGRRDPVLPIPGPSVTRQ